MAETSIKLYARKWAITSSSYPNDVQELTENYTSLYSSRRLYVGYDSLPASVPKHAKLITVDAVFNGRGTYQTGYNVFLKPCTADFNPSTLKWSNQPGGTSPEMYQYFFYGDRSDYYFDLSTSLSAKDKSAAVKKFLAYSAAYFYKTSDNGTPQIYYKLADGTSLPYLRVFYDPDELVTSHIAYDSGPASGYFSPSEAATFQWSFVKDDGIEFSCLDETFTQASATFYWKKSTDENYTSVAASGSQTSVTIPANTFPVASTIQWYVEGTDEDGTTTQTEVFSFSTAAGTAYATAKRPISEVVDGSAPITFTWEFSSTDGQAPSGVDLWWKLPAEDNNSWHALLSNASPVTSYTAAAGTFSAGEIQWIVRAYNIDGTAGPWSTPTSGYYSFICVAAPNPPAGLSATEVPLTTISWQSADQQGYEISIDGTVVKKAFGAGVYSWQVSEPLSDGTYEISVRVLGQYGFWSQPSTVTITVANTPPAVTTLNANFLVDAELYWSFDTDPGGLTAQIFRDGKLIAETVEQFYTDRTVLGEHSYYVIIGDSDGNYSQSNTVTGTMHADSKMIAPLDGSAGWLSLRLTENSSDAEDFQWSQTMVTQHVTGAIWPQLDRASFQDLSVSYSCAFRDPDEVRAFEALRGKIVIVKSRGDNVVIGMLSQVQKRTTVFYTSFYFTLQQIHVSDAGA